MRNPDGCQSSKGSIVRQCQPAAKEVLSSWGTKQRQYLSIVERLFSLRQQSSLQKQRKVGEIAYIETEYPARLLHLRFHFR